MQPIEIITIVLASLFFVSVIVGSIIKKKKGKSCCGHKCGSCMHDCDSNEKKDSNIK